MTGRPPTPNEEKKRRGTYRPGRDASLANVQELDRATEPPQPLRPLGEAGLAFWRSVWGNGLNWIAPQSDIYLVQIIAEQFDERATLRDLVMKEGVPRERSGLRELEKQLTSNLAALGLNPSERTRLGFAFVKTESKLAQLFRQRDEWEAEQQRRREQAQGEG